MPKGATDLDPVSASIQGEDVRKHGGAGWEDLVRESAVAHKETVLGPNLGNVHDIPGIVVHEAVVSITEARLVQGIRGKSVRVLSADVTPTVVTAVIEGLANAGCK